MVSKKGAYPKPLCRSFVVVDSSANFGCLSLYNTSNNIYEETSEGADITVAEPIFKTIKVGDFSYQCVQVFEVNGLLVNDS
jgi:hypothetical protein